MYNFTLLSVGQLFYKITAAFRGCCNLLLESVKSYATKARHKRACATELLSFGSSLFFPVASIFPGVLLQKFYC